MEEEPEIDVARVRGIFVETCGEQACAAGPPEDEELITLANTLRPGVFPDE